jgi:Zn-dependent peptidase ImmA (M78 family)
MAVSRTSSVIRKQAREVLSGLYRAYYEENGQYLSPDRFFPIDLKKIISSVMNWELESVAEIGYDRTGQRLKGHCDYENRNIRIAFQDINPDEKTFTIAHEIGHAILHSGAHSDRRGSARKRTTPRMASITLTNEERTMEKEANIFAAELLMPEKAVRGYFFRLFGRKEMWLGSPRAQQIMKGFRKRPQKSPFTLQSTRDIAPYFADYKKTDADPSMREFFGVSRSAMAIRLLELNLIYE